MSRLGLRVGRILSARRHPLAPALSVLEVDVGESAPRQAVSKLGEKTQLEEVTTCFRPSLINRHNTMELPSNVI